MKKLIASDNLKKGGYFCAFSIMAIGVIYNLITLIFPSIDKSLNVISVTWLATILMPFAFLRMIIPDILYFVIYYGFNFLILRRIWLIISLRKLSIPSTLTAPLWGIISISLGLVVVSLACTYGAVAFSLLFGRGIFIAGTGYLMTPALVLLPIGIGSVEFFSLLFDRSQTATNQNNLSNDAS